MDQPEYLSSQDAADRLGFTRQHIGRLIRRGDLQGKKLGRDWIVSLESVERLAAQKNNLRLPLSRLRTVIKSHRSKYKEQM